MPIYRAAVAVLDSAHGAIRVVEARGRAGLTAVGQLHRSQEPAELRRCLFESVAVFVRDVPNPAELVFLAPAERLERGALHRPGETRRVDSARFARELLTREELEYDDIEAIFAEYGKANPRAFAKYQPAEEKSGKESETGEKPTGEDSKTEEK